MDPYIIEKWEINTSDSAGTIDGIIVSNSEVHFIIRDVYVHSGGLKNRGIHLTSVINGRVENSIISGNTIGLGFVRTVNTTSVQNVITWNRYEGISVRWSVKLDIEENKVYSNNQTGIEIVESSDVIIVGNNISSNNDDGIRFSRSNNGTITSNNVSLNSRNGIVISLGNNFTIASNNLWDNGLADPSSYYDDNDGIRLAFSTNLTLEGNILDSDGITITGGTVNHYNTHTIGLDNLINSRPLHYYKDCTNLEVDGVSIGQLIVTNCKDVRVTHLQITATKRAIQMAFTDGAHIESNNLSFNDMGVDLRFSANISIISNNILFNKRNGILLLTVTNGVVKGNNISDNGFIGIGLTKSVDVRVHHNNIIRNNLQAFDKIGSNNAWNTAYPVGGNYWSDYSGEDGCSGPQQDVCPEPDGIGDTRYVTEDGIEDLSPLMKPYIPTNGPVAYFTIVASISSAGNFFVDASLAWDLHDFGETLEVRWDWEDDGIWDTNWSTTKTAEHQYSSPGTFTIRLEVRDMGGLTGNTTMQVMVEAVKSDTDTTGADEKKEAGLLPTSSSLILLGALLAIVGLIVLFLLLRKKKPEASDIVAEKIESQTEATSEPAPPPSPSPKAPMVPPPPSEKSLPSPPGDEIPPPTGT